jgi:hypothetical protein
MQDSRTANLSQESDSERMRRAIDSQPPEYFSAFGITKESWHHWRAGGKGTPSTGKKKWHFPRLIPLYYPDSINTTQDRMNWIAAVNMDMRLSERARRVLTRLVMCLNLKTGRCDPTIRVLGMLCGIGESDSAEVMTRAAVAAGERLGWIKRVRRHGGSTRYSQANSYEFRIPAAVLRNSREATE